MSKHRKVSSCFKIPVHLLPSTSCCGSKTSSKPLCFCWHMFEKYEGKKTVRDLCTKKWCAQEPSVGCVDLKIKIIGFANPVFPRGSSLQVQLGPNRVRLLQQWRNVENHIYIYICAQRVRPFCHPHGQKVGQGCGEALFTENTTLTRGWIGR